MVSCAQQCGRLAAYINHIALLFEAYVQFHEYMTMGLKTFFLVNFEPLKGQIDAGGPLGFPDYAGPPQRRMSGFGGFVPFLLFGLFYMSSTSVLKHVFGLNTCILIYFVPLSFNIE